MKTWMKRVALTACACATATSLVACGAGEERAGGGGAESSVGVTDTSVKIGGHFPLTGVAAPGYSEIPVGHQAYYDYVNKNGGVNGRTIEFLARDDAYNPTNTSRVVSELVLKDQVFAIVGGLGTPTHSAVVDSLNSEKVPDLFVSSGSLAWGNAVEKKPFTFGWQPDYEVEGKIIGDWIRKNKPQAKVGLFLQADDLGADGEKGVSHYIKDQVVQVVRYTPGNTEIGPQIAALQAAGADLVVGFNVPSYTALSQLGSLKLNYKPDWFYSNVGSDPSLVGSLLARFSDGAVGQSGGMLDGVMTTSYLADPDAQGDPWTDLWRKVWQQSGHQGELSGYHVYGMAQAYTFVQALQAAGPKPTREGIVAAIEKIGAELAGPALAPYRYSKDNHLGMSGVRVAQIKGGTLESVTPVLVTGSGDAPITPDNSGADQDKPTANGIPDVPEAK
ncbi:ABC transporter substrate-binding protein [Nocardia goodfellowii]